MKLPPAKILVLAVILCAIRPAEMLSQNVSEKKKVIYDHCNTQWAQKIGAPWGQFEHDGIAKVKAEPGQEVYPISNAQLDEWKKAAVPLEQKWADNVKKAGGAPDTIMKELKTSLQQYKAAY